MDFSLNYVWIQAVRLPVPESGQAITCPIPKGLMDNIHDTAQEHPDASINIWVDIYGIGGHPAPIMQSLNDLRTAPNIMFKALDNIPAYTTNPLFELPFDGFENPKATIWQQVDLARVYVLRDCLVNGDEDAAIYSDMDIIFQPKVVDILNSWGMVTNTSSCILDGMSLSENQLFGFQKNRLGFLINSLLPETARYIENGHNGWRGHVEVFGQDSQFLADAAIDFSDIILSVNCIEGAEGIKTSYQKKPPFFTSLFQSAPQQP